MWSGSLNLKYLSSAEKSPKAGKCEFQASEMTSNLRDSLHLGFLMVETQTRTIDWSGRLDGLKMSRCGCYTEFGSEGCLAGGSRDARIAMAPIKCAAKKTANTPAYDPN